MVLEEVKCRKKSLKMFLDHRFIFESKGILCIVTLFLPLVVDLSDDPRKKIDGKISLPSGVITQAIILFLCCCNQKMFCGGGRTAHLNDI